MERVLIFKPDSMMGDYMKFINFPRKGELINIKGDLWEVETVIHREGEYSIPEIHLKSIN